jgi:hypothetical protein
MKLRAGDLVEVRSKEEILRSLDKNGQLEGLPFMPQMFQYCGMRFRVFKRAHKTCDTVNQTGGRRLSKAVHLELRCDGEAYGGCQAACLIFWKDAWLKRVSELNNPEDQSSTVEHVANDQLANTACCTEAHVWSGTRVENQQTSDGQRYICQATQLPHFTTRLPWWDITQYIEDCSSGNATLGKIFRGLVYAGYFNLIQSGIGVGRPLRRLYDVFQAIWGGIPYPRWKGKIPAGQPTPMFTLNLQPGELVRVKPYKEILTTIDTNNKNRGLFFDAEMVPYCGNIYRVARRVNKIIDEKTGKMLTMKTESIILEGVWCQARYSDRRMFCPRSIYSLWREIWLERLTESNPSTEEPWAEKPSSIKKG